MSSPTYIEKEKLLCFLYDMPSFSTHSDVTGEDITCLRRDVVFHAATYAEPANVVPAPAWISVEDRLPDVQAADYWRSVTVIATDGKQTFPLEYERAIIRGEVKYRWRWPWGRLYDGKPITHWMQLPEPPKEDSNG